MLITDPLFYVIAIPAVILLGLAKGGFAGVGMASTPMVALVLPPLEAAAMLLPVLISQDMLSMWVYRRTWDARNLKIMLPGAAIGVGLAWALAAYITDSQVRLAIGVISVIFVLNGWFGRPPPLNPAPSGVTSGVFWGAMSGFTSTFAQAGSPPFQIYVLPQRLDRMVLVGTGVFFFAAVNLMKIPPYVALGQFSFRNLATSAALLPLAASANLLGVWMVRRVSTKLFYSITYVLVFIVGLELIRSGIVGMLRGEG